MAVAGSSRRTAAEAADHLRRAYGIEARPFDSVEAMCAETGPDIVAVCSPTRLHRRHLEILAGFPVHVFCEKPLWWGEDIRGGTEALLKPYRDRLLRLNTQWPYTLWAFRSLHGEEPLRKVERFAMRLSPIREGRERIVDSAPHLLSMLEALVGRGVLKDIRWEGFTRAEFEYHPHGKPPVRVEFFLETVLAPPRPAWYAVNDLRVDRRIRLPEYAFEFAAGDRTVRGPDPLDLAVKDFLEAVEKGDRTDIESLRDGVLHLQELCEAQAR